MTLTPRTDLTSPLSFGRAATTWALVCATLVFAGSNAPATAANAQIEGSKARVNLSARLRSLSEDLAATGCRVQNGIAGAESRQHLAEIREMFENILAGLENGDPRLGMQTAETRGSLLEAIAEVRGKWDPIASAVDRMLAGSATPADYDALVSGHADLLEETLSLAASMSGVYSDPNSLLQRDAITLNFLGRQRSLATRFARATCGIATENDGIGTQAELIEAMSTFDASYIALMNGFPSAGIGVPPSEAVKNVLVDGYNDWLEERSVIEDGLSGDMAQTAAISAKFGHDTVRTINNAITLYIIASPGQEDVFQTSLKAYATEQLLPWLEAPEVIEALRAQNAAHTGMTEDEVIALDNTWRAEAKGAEGDLISSTLARPLSAWLKDKQLGTGGIVTEVFVMDNLGLNVGQSDRTSDYWQGDEAKWKETYGAKAPAMHIGELEFDDSTQSYQTQASQMIVDPATGEPLGAVTFGINVINLM